MLINFTVSNFKSFKEEQSLLMTPFKKGEDAIETGFNAVPNVCLISAIYGANASGKSNLIEALCYMQCFVVHGFTMYKPKQKISRNFFGLCADCPTQLSLFEVTFILNERLYEYGFEIDDTRVLREYLSEISKDKNKQTRRMVLEREYGAEADEYSYRPSTLRKAWKSVRPNALALTAAAYNDDKEAQDIYAWFDDNLHILEESEEVSLAYTAQMHKDEGSDGFIGNFIKKASLGIEAFKEYDIEVTEKNLYSSNIIPEEVKKNVLGKKKTILFKHKSYDKNFNALPLFSQSIGTKRLLKYAGLLSDVLKSGSLLIIDELEKNLHPHMVEEIISLFQNPDTNPKNAQLIFTAHNTYFLNKLSKNQIWFCEKSDYGESELIALSEYKSRTGENIEINYNKGKYGGIPHLTGFGLPDDA